MLDTVSKDAARNASVVGAHKDEVVGWRKFFVDLKYLTLEQLLEVRTTWYWFLVFSLFMPLSMVFGFGRIGSGLSDRNSLLYIISGAAIFAVATEGIVTVSQKVTQMKKEGMMIYYASLPISKTAFIAAILLTRMLVTLPGMLVPIALGPLLYGINVEFSFWVLLLLPLCGLSLSAIGMTFGSLLNSVELVSVITNVLIFVLIFAAPVFIPVAALPLPLQIFGYLLPPTYAADALRLALSGTLDTMFYFDVAILLLMTVASLFALTRWLRWRLR